MHVVVPCGQCIGCRLERSRQWAIRCVHEAQLHNQNCFITLTYSDEYVPVGRSLVKADFQKFMKRLRKAFPDSSIRYYMCGEYGEQFGRPHFHACLFGFDFIDKTIWKKTNSGEHIYRSPSLEKIWPYGHSSIGSVTFNSAAYVARYVMKKRTGEQAQQWYEYVDEDGVIHHRLPEYTNMSLKPGIGHGWLEKYKSDVYPADTVVLKGKKMRPPRYYDLQFEMEYPSDFKRIKAARKSKAALHAENNTDSRLRVREEVQQARLKTLRRELK